MEHAVALSHMIYACMAIAIIFCFKLTLSIVKSLHSSLQADTARVIWSYHSNDPTSDSGIPEHEAKGSASLNLLGGLAEERVEPNSQDFSILVNNVRKSMKTSESICIRLCV